jgi:hypothetical protein
MDSTGPTVAFTHDVDKITEKRKHVWAVRQRFPRVDLLKGLIDPKTLYRNLEEIMSFEDRYDVHSTFFFSIDLYPIGEIVDVCQKLRDQKYEIAFHLVYDDYLKRTHDAKYVEEKKKKLEKILGVKVLGVRNHYLIHFGGPTFKMQQEAGFNYDSSLRATEIQTYHPYEPIKDFYEVPLTIMDSDLWGRWKLTENDGWKYIIGKLDEVMKEPNGIFVFNAHQCSFHMRGGRLYKDLVKEVNKRGCTVIQCRDLIDQLKRGEKTL